MKTITAYAVLIFSVFAAINANAAQCPDNLPGYDLSVAIYPDTGILNGTAEISLPVGASYDISTAGLDIINVTINGILQSVKPSQSIIARGKTLIQYEAVFKDTAQASARTPGPENLISKDGISLTGAWHPALGVQACYRLKAVLPKGYTAVSQAEDIIVTEKDAGYEHEFSFSYPSSGLTLAGGIYDVRSVDHNGVEIYTYMFPDDANYSDIYLDYAKEYLDIYTHMLGDFKFKRFSIVENILETGYSMPTYTLLGRSVIKLPFIPQTSLGHEILHQWFGNSIYASSEGGNWSEALTTYLSDYYFEERKSNGSEYRKKVLVDYKSHVNAENETPLSEFVSRTDFSSRAIGYGKGMMVLHMLKEEIGQKAFSAGIKVFISDMSFKTASWEDLKNAFQYSSGEDIGWFYDQWVQAKGIPSLSIEQPRALVMGGMHEVSFYIRQKGRPYRLLLPVTIITKSGEHSIKVRIDKEREYIKIPVFDQPQEIIIDGEYSLMRDLQDDEYPPVISRLLGSKKAIITTTESVKYAPLIDILTKGSGFTEKQQDEITEQDLLDSSILIAGENSTLLSELFGITATAPVCGTIEPEDNEEDLFEVSLYNNPYNPSLVIAHATANTEKAVRLSAGKIYRYGRHSHISFRNGKNTLSETQDTEDGIRASLRRYVTGIKTEKALSIDDIFEDIKDTPVIYIGEAHTAYEDHLVQLDIIRRLKDSGRQFAIGMEMFQTPYQQSLDDYISGSMDEKSFLKSSEYYSKWAFNFHLYREILDYAKTNGIPIVALNQESEIIKKVSKAGIKSLSEDERQKVPKDMDLSDAGYRKRLTDSFGQHENSKDMDFNHFYQAQLLWDETMAHAIFGYLKSNPKTQMVVLAGSGHIAYGSGIPKRAYRLTGLDFVTLMNSKSSTSISGIADYVLFPEPIPAPSPPMLGILLAKDGKSGKVMIGVVSKGSPAERAGIKKGDILLSIDGLEIEGIPDVHVSLYDKFNGDKIKIKVLRRRFILKDKMLEIEAVL